jgi:hypothetical protein
VWRPEFAWRHSDHGTGAPSNIKSRVGRRRRLEDQPNGDNDDDPGGDIREDDAVPELAPGIITCADRIVFRRVGNTRCRRGWAISCSVGSSQRNYHGGLVALGDNGTQVARLRERRFILHEADRSKAMQANDMTRDMVESITCKVMACVLALAHGEKVPNFLPAHGCVRMTAAHLLCRSN